MSEWASEEYTCTICHGTFLKGRPDAEAQAEAEASGLYDPDGDNVIVCEDCYAEFIAWHRRQWN